MSYYEQHIFVCTNEKELGKTCCAKSGGEPYFDYLRSKIKEIDAFGPGKIRISKSGCLGRCRLGPCLVVYPEGLWYTYHSFADLDEIIDGYLVNGQKIDRLMID